MTTHDAGPAHDLVAAGRALVAAGLSPGTSGNLSALAGKEMLLSPTGVRLDELSPGHLARVDLLGSHVGGPPPSKEHWLHRAMYRRNPATRAVVHVHSRAATAVSCLAPWREASAVPPLTPYFVMRVGQTPLIPYAAPGDRAQAEALERLALPLRAALLQNHGPVVGGASIEAALDAAIELEEACQLYLSLAGHNPRPLSEADARALAERYGTPWATL